MKGLAAALSLAVVLSAVEGRAAPQEQPPRTTFRSAVDLVPVDVSVVDRNGRPVSDLSVGDFTLTVDGKPRRIASAQFIAAERTTQEAPPKPMEYTSNAGATAGRLIMIVVDANNIGAGRGRAAFEAARRFVGALDRSDRVALVTLPGPGPQMEFTANHAIVQALLAKVTGLANDNIGQKRVGLSEAIALERGDTTVLPAMIERECPQNFSAPEILTSCLTQLNAEARQMIAQVQQRTDNALLSLRYLLERLTTSDAPKTVVLISEGLLIGREYSDVAWVEPRAAAARVSLFVLHLDTPEAEAKSRRASPSRGEDRELLRDGLDRVAGLAKGNVFRVAGNADFVFQRLSLELSGYYLLSFEPEPGDRDGKPHKIKIDVSRRDLTLRARREFSVGPAGARSIEEVAVETLRSPLLATDIPLKLTTYTFQEGDATKLKVVVVTDIDRSLSPGGKVSVGYMMFDDNGKLVTSQLEKGIDIPIDPQRKTQKHIGGLLTTPGAYTLKVAVIDDAGNRGSVERTFAARINGFGQLRASDMVIADNSARGGNGLPPAVAADFTGGQLHGFLELSSEVPEQLTNATVILEVAQDEAGRALDSTPARFQPVRAGTEGKRGVEASVPIALLPSGEYVARAVISVGGRKVGQVVRPFRVIRAAPVVAAPGTSTVALKTTAPIAFTSRVDAFNKASVLTPQVLGFFLDRMSAAAAASAAAVKPAVASVKAGRFDEAMDTLKTAGDDQLAAVFLKGVILLQRGDLEGAAGRFRAALRLDPEFYSAAFYLGACYAAGGKDRDAAGAWQMSLITESSAPFVYTLLGDALLRLRDMDQALDVLTEARTLWPADDDVTVRLGTALVLANKSADAVKVLQPYLDAHPADHEVLFVAMRALYEARAAGRAIETVAADKVRFIKYADAYAAAKGSQQALVDQWRKYIESQR
jgi:VWFA-related protein